jgi:fructokinase
VIVGIETGGTKVICATAHEHAPLDRVETVRFPTTTPRATIGRINEFLRTTRASHSVTGIGIASFGPLNVERGADRYGWITATTKPGWANTDLLGGLEADRAIIAPLVTDVTGAAIGESFARSGRAGHSLAYATFGTGVGVGLLVNGGVMMGNGYPEMAHIRVKRHPRDQFDGSCPFHGDCLEGLASGPAAAQRWGADASSLSGDTSSEARDFLAWYLGQLLATLAFTFGPLPTVLGGGVMKTPALLDLVRVEFTRLVGGALPTGTTTLADLVGAPRLGDFSGVGGALVLASQRELPSTAAVPAQA